MISRNLIGSMIALSICGLLLASCARPVGAAREVGTETIDRTYRQARLTWQHGKGGVIAAVKAKNEGGDLVICGAWAELTGEENPDLTGKVVDRAQVRLDDELIFGDLRSFRRAKPGASLRGESATCVEAGRAWEDRFRGKPATVKYFTGTYLTSS